MVKIYAEILAYDNDVDDRSGEPGAIKRSNRPGFTFFIDYILKGEHLGEDINERVAAKIEPEKYMAKIQNSYQSVTEQLKFIPLGTPDFPKWNGVYVLQSVNYDDITCVLAFDEIMDFVIPDAIGLEDTDDYYYIAPLARSQFILLNPKTCDIEAHRASFESYVEEYLKVKEPEHVFSDTILEYSLKTGYLRKCAKVYSS